VTRSHTVSAAFANWVGYSVMTPQNVIQPSVNNVIMQMPL